MTADIVTLPNKKISSRPDNAWYSEVVEYTSTTRIGFDVIEADGTAIVFREIEGKIGFVPCPDVGTAMVVLLMLHHELKASLVAYDFDSEDGFHCRAADEQLDELFTHYGPHLKLMGEHGLPPFDEAFDRTAHTERVYDGLEIIPMG